MITFNSLLFGNWKYEYKYKNEKGITEIIFENNYQEFLKELKRFGKYEEYISKINKDVPDKEKNEQYNIFDYI